MAKRLTFSVGIPTYNQAEYIEETLLSLLNQTRPPDEIVVSDHDSTDATPDILAKYSSHLRVVHPPKGTNLAGQYTFTLQNQTGDWITLLSSDDIAHPNFCEALMRGAERRSDAVLVRAGWRNMEPNGDFTNQYLLSVKPVTEPPETVLEQSRGIKVGFAAFALSRDGFARCAPIDPRMESLADAALFLQIAPYGSFIYENEIIATYRVLPGPDKFKQRLGMWVRDIQRLYEDIIPEAARACGVTDHSFIANAYRAAFDDNLAAAGQRYAAEERGRVVELMRPWARTVHREDALDAFAAGEQVKVPFDLKRTLRHAARPLAQTAYGLLRRK